MARAKIIYRTVNPGVWGDRKFQQLDDRSRLLFFYLLTAPDRGPIPGIWETTLETIARRMRWGSTDTTGVLNRLRVAEMVLYDFQPGLFFLPKAVAHEPYLAMSHVQGWARYWRMLPECDLRDHAVHTMGAALHTYWGAEQAKAFHVFAHATQPATEFGRTAGVQLEFTASDAPGAATDAATAAGVNAVHPSVNKPPGSPPPTTPPSPRGGTCSDNSTPPAQREREQEPNKETLGNLKVSIAQARERAARRTDAALPHVEWNGKSEATATELLGRYSVAEICDVLDRAWSQVFEGALPELVVRQVFADVQTFEGRRTGSSDQYWELAKRFTQGGSQAG